MYEPTTQSDAALAASVEDGTLHLSDFNHRAHLRVAWHYLGRMPFGQAGQRLSSAIRSYGAAHGKAGLFHETMTWAYLALMNERRVAGASASFDEFAALHPDLLDHRGGALSRLYPPETLASDLARRVFVLPRGR